MSLKEQLADYRAGFPSGDIPQLTPPTSLSLLESYLSELPL